MNSLTIPRLHLVAPSIQEVSRAINEAGALATINVVNWTDYPHKPHVSFAMAYDEAALYLKFYVQEEHIRAVETQPNSNVWEDSCCEFFCAFDNKGYYNLETNCIGTQLLGWGPKGDRKHAADSVIHSITKHSTLGSEPLKAQSGNFDYQITMMIPATAFFAHQMSFKEGTRFRANFYKCGDKTPVPHFLSWNPIDIPKPDFHRPDFFGEIKASP